MVLYPKLSSNYLRISSAMRRFFDNLQDIPVQGGAVACVGGLGPNWYVFAIKSIILSLAVYFVTTFVMLV